MNDVAGVALFSTLKWPKDALGERPLLVFESYDPSVWNRDGGSGSDAITGLRDRGFEPLLPEGWSFPYLDDHLLAIDEPDDDFALIDDAADQLFGYPISAIPGEWYSHLKMERNCLVLTGVELGLATAGMNGVKAACEDGRAFGAMVLINDGSVLGR